MIVDVFPYDGEEDILDIRLAELGGVVDRFIALTGDRTFMGEVRPHPHVPRGVEAVRVALPEVAETGWHRDRVQRDACPPLDHADVVIHGDVDEVPPRAEVAAFAGPPRAFEMAHLVYDETTAYPEPWRGSVIGRVADVPSGYDCRSARHRLPAIGGGWHLSWFGLPAERERKLLAFSHEELRHLAGRVGTELPAAGIHPDGTPLVPYSGPLPRWFS